MLLNWFRTAVKNAFIAGVHDALTALGVSPNGDDETTATARQLLTCLAKPHGEAPALELHPETPARNGRGRQKAEAAA